MKKDLNIFLDSINKLAPLKYKKYKMPYKPAILLSIFNVSKQEWFDIFNQWIDFSNYDSSTLGTKIIKQYYNIITSIPDVFEILKKYCDKNMMENFQIGFNEKTFKSIRKHLFSLPLEKLSKNNNFLEIDKTNKRIKFNNDINDDYELIDKIISLSFQSLRNSNEYYEKLELNQILNYDSYIEQKLVNNYQKKFSKVEIRQYQYWFSKMVKDRDTKCVICCEDYPGLLEAAHIKPYAKCDSQSMFDSLNGITLCKNHHSLFDEGYFTFNNDWTIKLSKADKFKLYKEDLDLKFKQYESCFDKLKVTKHNITVYDTIHNYLKYHQENVFKK